jgi:AraC-like DNA-binding protein
MLLYIDEHTTCTNYVSDFHAGFKICDLNGGEPLLLSRHDYNCLIFTLLGEAKILYNTQTYVLKPKSIAFVPMFDDFKLNAETNYQSVIHYFNKPTELCEKFSLERLTGYVEKDEFTVLYTVEILDNFITSMCYFLNQGANCKHFYEIKHQELLFILRFFYKKEDIAKLFSSIISQNIDFKSQILQKYTKAYNVQELAKLCNYSLPTFNRLFKKNFNESPLQWLKQHKLQHIKAKLAMCNIPLSEIVYEFSFSSAGHFTAFCKKNLGKTPREFRKEIKKGLSQKEC